MENKNKPKSMKIKIKEKDKEKVYWLNYDEWKALKNFRNGK